MGRDYTIFATQEGYVKYEYVSKGRKQVSVYPERV
jgi:ribosomal protein L27